MPGPASDGSSVFPRRLGPGSRPDQDRVDWQAAMMSRLYDHPERDAVDVRPEVGGTRPAQFLWRGRLYVVRTVLAHWVEAGAWWRVRLPDGLPARIDERGREVWRVEAHAGRTTAAGVYDLAYDQVAATWTLARALD